MSGQRFTNRLAQESSPYLQQHAHNPVDWYPWGEEALARAKAEDKPILLSIGYSACHWCHVMEHESFENESIARLMNENYVNIKVDREERPDLDQIYMTAVQMMTRHGGWPLTVFLTPDLVPFYGGTYFPPEDRYNMPGFPRILLGVADAYRTQARRGQAVRVGNPLGAAPRRPRRRVGEGALARAARRRFRIHQPRLRPRVGRLRRRAEIPLADESRIPAALPPALRQPAGA